MKNELVDIPFSEYLDSHYWGMGERRAFSNSDLKLISPEGVEDGCPQLLKWTKENNPEDPKKDHFILGRALHARTLEGKQSYVIRPDTYPSPEKVYENAEGWEDLIAAGAEIVPAKGRAKAHILHKVQKPWNLNSNWCRDWSKEQGGADILSSAQHRDVLAWDKAIKSNSVAGDLLAVEGRSEICGFAQDPETGIWLRIRIDWLPTYGTALVDLKTAASVAPGAFGQSAYSCRHFVQGALYLDAYNIIAVELGLPPKTDFVFITVRKEAPHFVKVYRMSDSDLQLGREAYQRDLRRLRTCLDGDTWPGPGAGEDAIEYLQLPRKAYKEAA